MVKRRRCPRARTHTQFALQFDMVSIQNATLAGGVAVGTTSDLVILPWAAILIGIVSGTLSVVGYIKIQPWLAGFGLDDTCGVYCLAPEVVPIVRTSLFGCRTRKRMSKLSSPTFIDGPPWKSDPHKPF